LRYVEPGVAPAYVPLSHTVIDPPPDAAGDALEPAVRTSAALTEAASASTSAVFRLMRVEVVANPCMTPPFLDVARTALMPPGSR
jgi:hypothetical protein